MVHHNDKIFEGMEIYGIDREVVWSYEFNYDKNPNDFFFFFLNHVFDLRRNEDFFFFFWLIVSGGKSNEENKLKLVTSLRFYG